MPKSGSTKTRAKSTPTHARGLKGSPEPGGSRATAQLKRRTAASFANSAGCMLMGPRSSHLLRAVHLGPDPRDEDEHEADQNDQVQSRGVLAPCGVPDAARHEEDGDPEHHVHDADEQEIGPDLTVGSRVDHDEPQEREAQEPRGTGSPSGYSSSDGPH